MTLPSSPTETDVLESPKSGPVEVSTGEMRQTGAAVPVREIGGRRDGTEPTRFGDWEKGGRCIDF